MSQQFAEAVLAAFKAAGAHTDTDVAAKRGPSTTWMTGLRKAAKGEIELKHPRQPIMDAIDRVARWAPGSAARVWEGGEPEPLAALVAPDESGRDIVTFSLKGNFGVDVTLQGPVSNLDELEASVARLLRSMGDPSGNPAHSDVG